MPTIFTPARAAVAVAAVLTAAVLGATPASAVAHGTLASPGQYPFAVKLTMTHIPRPGGTFYDSACSAALISPTWIITAGHCFHDINRNPISGPVPYATTATLNTVDLSQAPGEVRRVTDVRQAPETDISLARLSAPVTDVTPLGLSKARGKPATRRLLTIAGWGATTSINPTPATRLSTGQVKIRTVKSITITVVGHYPAADTSACLYDSGAPYHAQTSRTAARLRRKQRTRLPAHQPGNHRPSRHHHQVDQDHRSRSAMLEPQGNTDTNPVRIPPRGSVRRVGERAAILLLFSWVTDAG